MTRPGIIRADTIDLQDQNAPSAQDHSRQTARPAVQGDSPRAPHQAETLRELAVEVAEENQHSPGLSREWANGEAQQQQYSDNNSANSQQQDHLAVAQNGGLTGSAAEDADMADAEGDDGMDDDMMDKISSSPSIDDGGYSLPHLWPQRSDSLKRNLIRPPSLSQACGESSSPFVETPEHFPLRQPPDPSDRDAVESPFGQKYDRHLPGKYLDQFGGTQPEFEAYTEKESLGPNTGKYCVESYDADFIMDYLEEEILTGYLASLEKNEISQPKLLHQDNTAEFESNRYASETGDNQSDDILKDTANEKNYDQEDEGVMIPYESSEDDEDDDYDFPSATKSRFIDSGWGGECLQKLEDIDFEFVYALHTFVATVEGQANATKGDTMVLLDDSNSYWWLVRVVKDSSIGYLPAEHIETPTERLARLNKHRNIDLTTQMLGDQTEKSKNPLKIAMRRRNAKTVQFTAPTYVEASDIDYSSDEEEGDGDFYGQNGQQEQVTDQQEPAVDEDEIVAIEPLKPRTEIREVKSEIKESTVTKVASDSSRNSDEIFDGKPESKSRNGTLRNTDSFFKDDTVETRKITLTPNLLRDDSSTSTRTSNDSKDARQRPSLDKLEKDSPERNKDKRDRKDKKDKEKKPGMLSGLFKRKDKKSKTMEDEMDESTSGKHSTENSRSSPDPEKDSDEIVAVEEQAIQPQELQRQPSKLQKQPRTEISPIRKPGQGREPKPSEQIAMSDRAPTTESIHAPSMRLVQPEPSLENTRDAAMAVSPEQTKDTTPVMTSTREQKPGGQISKILRSASNAETKPIKTRKAKSRVELDDFDSSPEASPVEGPPRSSSKQARPIPGAFPDSYMTATPSQQPNPAEERLSESPVQISPVTASQSYLPALMVDTSSQEEPLSPATSPSPELIEVEDAQEKRGPGSTTTSSSTPTWSDAHLRTFFDDDADIKDLLVVVYDKSGVVPAGPDHPVTGSLFREENAKLADITNRLDGMLGDWLARKSRTQSSR